MDLSVITVTWNAKDQIAEQIASVFSGFNQADCEQIIVDNNSSDETIDIIKEKFSAVRLIENKKNAGFGAANNQGVKMARGDFFLFLNPDMKVEPDSLDKMVDWMKAHPEAGIASCKLVDKNGKLNEEAKPRRFPKAWEMVVMIFKLPHLFPAILNSYLMADFDENKEQEVDSVRGAFLLMRREVVNQLGWAWDPRYYFWFEDVDICREAKRLGFKVMYTPIISCVDYVGASFKKKGSVWKQKQFTKSMVQYFRKWEPWYVWMPIYILRPVGIFLARVSDFVNRKNYKLQITNNK